MAAVSAADSFAFSIFDEHDLDKDGCLDRAECSKLVQAFMGRMDLELLPEHEDKLLTTHFENADTNQDGKLSRDEFEGFVDSLTAIASAIASAGSSGQAGAASSSKNEGQTAALFDDEGRVDMEMFRKFDVNEDHKLDVTEAQAFLKSILCDWGLSSSWVTPTWVQEQFKLINTDDDAATCTEAEFQGFCESISQFLSHLGAAMGADEPEEGADKQVARTESKIMLLAPPAPAEDDDDDVLRKRKGGCACVIA